MWRAEIDAFLRATLRIELHPEKTQNYIAEKAGQFYLVSGFSAIIGFSRKAMREGYGNRLKRLKQQYDNGVKNDKRKALRSLGRLACLCAVCQHILFEEKSLSKVRRIVHFAGIHRAFK